MKMVRNMQKIELIGEGPYSVLLLRELLRRKINVIKYVTPEDNGPYTDAVKSWCVDVKTFPNARGLLKVIGDGDISVVFDLGLKLPKYITEKNMGRLWNIHPSLLPEFAGVADPVAEMLKQGREYGGMTIHEISTEVYGGKNNKPIASI